MILSRRIVSRFSSEAGRLFTWEKGQKVKELKLQETITKAAIGPNHSLVIGQSGKVYSFGTNQNGELGHGDKKKCEAPKQIQYFSKNKIAIKDISCGEKHSLALDENGQVYSFGFGGKDRGTIMKLFINPIGPLGHGTAGNCLKPTKISSLSDVKVGRMTCGRQFNTVVTAEGHVYNWGNGEYGAFGDGQNSNYLVPTLNSYFEYLQNEENIVVKKVKSCESYSIALLSDGKLYGWGSNESGQMGVKSEIGIEIYETVNYPTEVIRQGYEEQQVVNFDISENTMIFQLANGELWWAGMKMAYKPQKVKLEIQHPRLFAAGNKSFAVVDQQNNLFTNLEYVKGKSEENLYTGIKKIKGEDLFGGEIIGIGGDYNTRYAIVK